MNIPSLQIRCISSYSLLGLAAGYIPTFKYHWCESVLLFRLYFRAGDRFLKDPEVCAHDAQHITPLLANLANLANPLPPQPSYR